MKYFRPGRALEEEVCDAVMLALKKADITAYSI